MTSETTQSPSSSKGNPATSDRRQSNPDPEEERLCLLQNSDFHLLKVEHGKELVDEHWMEISSLKVVTPASDPTIAEDVKQKGWYCLSHLRGDPSEWIVWDDAGVVDGRTGELIKAKVHPSKRDEIMELLQWRSGYWWIDIFCAQPVTPLGIMGDIYKLCQECFALIDSPYEPFYSKHVYAFTNAALLSSECLNQAADGYLDIICKTHRKDYGSTEWLQVLKDLLHWPYTHFDEKANQELIAWKERYSKGPRAEQFFDSLMQHPVDERMATAQKFFYSKEYNPSDFRLSAEDIMELVQGYSLESLIKIQQGVAEFLNCRWMNRVWTLQELALPRLTTLPRVGPSPYPFEFWLTDFSTLLKVIAKAYEVRETTNMDNQSDLERGTVLRTPREVMNYYQRTDPVLARIYSDYRKVLEVAIAIGYTSGVRAEKDNNGNLGRRIILNSLATSQRKALYPEDYVYGVLGILDIDIPRLKDRNKIWRIFSEKLRERYPDIHVPSDVNLDKATKMEDVYGNFKFPRGSDISSEVVEYLCKNIFS